MNKELLQQKAEKYSNAVGDDEYDAFLAGAKEILDNPELYELVKKDLSSVADSNVVDIIRQEAEAEEIYEPKYGGKDHSGYSTMMLYEVNGERNECFEKGGLFGYNLSKKETDSLKKENKELKESYEILKFDSDASIQQYWLSQNEIAELKEKVTELEGVIAKLSQKVILYECNY